MNSNYFNVRFLSGSAATQEILWLTWILENFSSCATQLFREFLSSLESRCCWTTYNEFKFIALCFNLFVPHFLWRRKLPTALKSKLWKNSTSTVWQLNRCQVSDSPPECSCFFFCSENFKPATKTDLSLLIDFLTRQFIGVWWAVIFYSKRVLQFESECEALI